MDAPDVEIMAYAAKYDYVVLTHDLDFSAILAVTQGTKPSVVQIRADNISAAVIGDPLIAALQQMAPELAAGALLTVDPGRTRLHLLPLRSNEPRIVASQTVAEARRPSPHARVPSTLAP